MRITPLAAALALGAAPLAAQTVPARPIELGVDGALTAAFTDGTTNVNLNVPVSRLRAGFFLGDHVSLEPSAALFVTRSRFEVPEVTFDGTGVVVGSTRDVTVTATGVSLDLGLLYHFGDRRPGARATDTRPYVRPLLGLDAFRASGPEDDLGNSGSASQAQFRYGVGLGVRRRIVDRLAFRVEGVVSRTQGDTQPDVTSAGATFGFSFFVR